MTSFFYFVKRRDSSANSLHTPHVNARNSIKIEITTRTTTQINKKLPTNEQKKITLFYHN